MALRTWIPLSPEEHARRRKLLRLIVLIQAGGLTIGGVASLITALTSPSVSGRFGSALPFVMVGLCWLVYRLSKQHWYGAVYLYSFLTVLLNISGLYALGGAQGPMAIFFLWIIFTAGMLIDLRAAWEMVIVSLVVYGFFAVGQPLGWIKLNTEAFASTAYLVFPIFLSMMFVLIGFLTWLFGDSLNKAMEQTRTLAGTLEDEVQQRAIVNLQLVERNRQLEELAERNQRRALQLQTAAEISNTVSQVMGTEELFSRVVELIRQRFNFYYVGLFLVDAENRYAVLQQGTGEAGRTMKERGHRLEVGGRSMVGWACANRQARIALDVSQETVRYANPLLPETRSEMALPLRLGGQALGALSVQSTQPAAFDQDDIAVLQGMADQIAVALENARLFRQTQATLQELEKTNRAMVREGWEGYLERQAKTRRTEFAPPNAPAAETLAEALSIPLELRGQPIGRLTLRREGDHPWSDEEVDMLRAIALQTVLAADNARLFDEAQRLAQRERLINEITARIRGSLTLEGILNSAIRELSHVTGARYGKIKLEMAETN